MNAYLKTEEQIFKNVLNGIKYRERKLIDLYLSHQKAIIEKIEAYTVNIQAITRNKYKIARLENLYREIDSEIIKLMTKAGNSIKKDIVDVYNNTYYQTAFNIERVVNVQLADLSANTRLVMNFAELQTEAVEAALFGDIAGHTFTDRINYDKARLRWETRTQVANAVVEGIGPQELARRLKKIDNVFMASNAKVNATARTELLRAYSLGNEAITDEAINAGVEFDYEWDSTLDTKTRPSHANADGQKAKIVDGKPMFNVNGVLLSSPRVTHPNNVANSAGEVINCRCRRKNIPFGVKPTRRVSKMQDGTWKEVDGDLTYKEWYSKYYKSA